MGFQPARALPVRTTRGVLGVVAVAMLSISTLSLPAQGASGGIVVSVKVPNATSISTTGCAAGTQNVTSFGTVIPGDSARALGGCVVTFGASNSTASLRVSNTYGGGRALTSVGNGAVDGGWGNAAGFLAMTQSSDNDLAHTGVSTQDGGVVLAGSCEVPITGEDMCVTKLQPNGAIDATFGTGGTTTYSSQSVVSNDHIVSIVQTGDGSLIAGGRCESPLPDDQDFCVVKFDSDGDIDTTFGDNGAVVTDIAGGLHTDYLLQIELLSNGKILAIGTCVEVGLSFQTCMARYSADGTLDLTFGNAGTYLQPGNGISFDTLEQPTGKTIAGESCVPGATGTDFCLRRYNVDGSEDLSFGNLGVASAAMSPGTGQDMLKRFAPATGGSFYAVGECEMEGVSDNDLCVAKFLSTGALDTTYNTDGIATPSIAPGVDQITVNGAVLMPDDSLLIAGTCFRATQDSCLIRLTASGVLDTRFDTDGIMYHDHGASSSEYYDVVRSTDESMIAI